MQNYFLLVAFLVLSVHVPGQDRSDRRVAARVAEQRAHAVFTPFSPFTPTEALTLREALVGPVVEAAAFMTPSRTALAGLLAQPPDQLTLEIPTGDGSVALDLVRADIHSSGFSLVTASTGAPVELVSGAHYRGTIAGDPNTLAAISIFADEVMGFVSDAAGNHVLGKLEGDTDDHIFYNDRDLIDPPVFACHTSDEGAVRVERPATSQDLARTARCVELYWEVDHDIFLDKGGVTNTTNFITGLFNQHATLFDNDGISVQLSELFIWDVPSPYAGNTSQALLNQFQATNNGFNGDVGHLLDYTNDGGRASFDGLCASDPDDRLCYSGIQNSFSGVPVYSFSVIVVTHEEGHVLGSPHTHACVWNGTNTAIDGCGPAEGFPYEGACSGAPIPENGGTIMSYCHLSPVGINFNNGFGLQPAALIITNVDAAPCVGACGAVGCDMPLDLSSNALANSATVSWAAVNGATAYTLQWKQSTTAMWITVAGITATSQDLTSLFPAVTYSYRVRTECAGGPSAFSPVHTFTTPCTYGASCDDGDPFTTSDIIVSDCVCAGTPPPTFQEIDKLVAGDRAEYDLFGSSVAISGDHAIVGAINADDNIDWNGRPGAAYIYMRSGDTWIQQQMILPSDTYGGEFGVSVAIDGDYAIVGAHHEGHDATGINFIDHAGAAYIYVRSGNTWIQQQRIVASDRAYFALFGGSVAISGDYAIVGAERDSYNGYTSIGSAYIFKRNGSTWNQQQKIILSQGAEDNAWFGASVAMSGDYAIIGSPYEDIGSYYWAGAAYIYLRNGSTWSQQERIWASDRASGDQFGTSVAISGDHVIVGVPKENALPLVSNDLGAAYIFARNGNDWTQQQKLVASDRENDDRFGQSVAISGDHAIVGAYTEDHDATGGNALGDAGSAYIFVRSDTLWTQLQKVVASDRAASDQFSVSVAIHGEHAMIGAHWEDEDEFGANTIYNAGSVYYLVLDTGQVDIPTGLDASQTTDLRVYPVPTSGVLNLSFPDMRAYRADVIGLDGRSVLALGIVHGGTPVDVSALASGAYLLRITSLANEVRFVRFVKELSPR